MNDFGDLPDYGRCREAEAVLHHGRTAPLSAAACAVRI